MEKFWIKYVNKDSKASGTKFLVREIPGYPDHYFISDGGSHVGGGKLARKYCERV